MGVGSWQRLLFCGVCHYRIILGRVGRARASKEVRTVGCGACGDAVLTPQRLQCAGLSRRSLSRNFPKLPRKKQGIDILSTYLLLGLLPERPPAVYFSVMMLASLEFRRLSGAYPG